MKTLSQKEAKIEKWKKKNRDKSQYLISPQIMIWLWWSSQLQIPHMLANATVPSVMLVCDWLLKKQLMGYSHLGHMIAPFRLSGIRWLVGRIRKRWCGKLTLSARSHHDNEVTTCGPCLFGPLVGYSRVVILYPSVSRWLIL